MRSAMDSEDDELIQRMNDLKQVFRGDWVGTILVMLRRGGKQYRQLRDETQAWSLQDPWTGKNRTLSNGELARTLTRMVEDRLLVRTEVPNQWQPAVFYELSDAARQLLAAVDPLLTWVGDNPGFFVSARGARGTGLRGDMRAQ